MEVTDYERKNLIGRHVLHQTLGKGVIIHQEFSDIIIFDVSFNDECKSFKYPDAFENRTLQCYDPKFLEIIKEDIKNKNVNNNVIENNDINNETVLRELQYVDFLIAYNTFKCKAKKHKLIEITALVNIMVRDKGQVLEQVPAYYCEECEAYFISKREFNSLKSKGILMCKHYDDEEKYYKTKYSGSLKLSQESILMQYGYNVSQENNLSDNERQEILGFLIDNRIVDKTTILNYFDFFIKQRENQNKDFSQAINKWKKDAKYVYYYKIGDFTKVYVKSIT